MSVVSAIVVAGVVTFLAVATKSWVLLLILMLAYIAGVTWERVVYATAVGHYKGMVAKLDDRVKQLEGGEHAKEAGKDTLPTAPTS